MSDRLNELLCGWATGRTAGEEKLKQLAGRVMSDVLRQKYLVTAPDGSGVFIPFWFKLKYAALGAVVCLLLSFCYLRFHPTSNGAGADERAAESLALIPTDQVRMKGRLFGEMERLFTDRLRWVAESDGHVGMGLQSLHGDEMPVASPVYVRLTAVSRKAGGTAWRRVWCADVVLFGEEMAQVAPDPSTGNTVNLWIYPLVDGKIAVDTSVALDFPVSLSSRINTVVADGKPVEIASLRTEDAEYRVFQTVEVVRNKT